MRLNGYVLDMVVVSLLGVIMIAGASCGGGGDSDTVLGSEGESCTKAADCQSGLKCIALVCVKGDEPDTDVQGRTDTVNAQDTAGCDPVCSGKVCGSDGCGGSCGTCTSSESCQSGQCVEGPCVPDCSGQECGDGGCDDEPGVCGYCAEGESCQFGQCVEVPCVPDCSGKECGNGGCQEQPDACGHCAEEESCQSGQCVEAPCVPDCSGKECGNGGCQEQPDACGKCIGKGESCEAGQCVGGVVEGIWTDLTSSLSWEDPPESNPCDFGAATAYCEGLTLGGYTDWHVPSISELRALLRGCPATAPTGPCNVAAGSCMEWSCMDGSCTGCVQGSGPTSGCYWPDGIQGTCGWYWSSTPCLDPSGNGWSIDFNDGGVDYGGFDSARSVRCVR